MFGEFKENFKNKPEAEISKTMWFCVLKICKYNTIQSNVFNLEKCYFL